jgi:hypothetical protein
MVVADIFLGLDREVTAMRLLELLLRTPTNPS